MKKFTAILVCLLMIVTCGLAGCAGFSINKVKYYNEILATVGGEHITRYEVLSAYNSYGKNYYVEQRGQNESEAIASTLDLLIDRANLYQYALENNNIYKPNPHQINDIVTEIFDAVDEQMDTYIETAKKLLKLEITTDEDKKDETAYKLSDLPYEKRAYVASRTVYFLDAEKTKKSSTATEYSDVEYYIDYNENYKKHTEELTEDTAKIGLAYLNSFMNDSTITQIKLRYFKHLKEDLEFEEKENATEIFNTVKELFANDLINYEYYLRDSNGKPYNKVSEDLFTRYFKRTFEDKLQSQYIENVRVHFLEQGDSLITINELEDKFDYLRDINFNLYNNNIELYRDTMKDISTKGDTVLYHPTSNDTKFGYFIHTLISFDTNQKENIKLLDEEKDPDKRQAVYKDIVSHVNVKARDLEKGVVLEETTASNLESILKDYNKLKNASYENLETKMSAFVKFMYQYTGDTATLANNVMPYVVGYDPTTYTGEVDSNDKLIGAYSGMVNEFTKEAIKLMQGNRGDMSAVANATDFDSMCITEYGIHLLLYVGDVNSYDIPYDTAKNYTITNGEAAEGVYNLYTEVINPLNGKTYFDMMFDLVYPASGDEVYPAESGYSDHEEGILSARENRVTRYVDKIKATKTTI